MKFRILLGLVAVVATVMIPNVSLAQSFGGVALTLVPCRTEAMRGDQVCFTITVTNGTNQTFSNLSLNLISDPLDINFFMTSNGGEIHPGHTFWTISLNPGQSLVIKARSQILASTPGKIVRVLLGVGGNGLLTQATYADIRILGRLLPVTGVDLSAIRGYRK